MNIIYAMQIRYVHPLMLQPQGPILPLLSIVQPTKLYI